MHHNSCFRQEHISGCMWLFKKIICCDIFLTLVSKHQLTSINVEGSNLRKESQITQFPGNWHTKLICTIIFLYYVNVFVRIKTIIKSNKTRAGKGLIQLKPNKTLNVNKSGKIYDNYLRCVVMWIEVIQRSRWTIGWQWTCVKS